MKLLLFQSQSIEGAIQNGQISEWAIKKFS